MKVAIIPARGGSKRIPRKNIKLFCGKPMINWSIEAAKMCGFFDRIIVSTDDTEIAELATEIGAEVPFMRPRELADDYTGIMPVIAHTIEWINCNIGVVTYACCIYPTAPFVRPEDIRIGYEKLHLSGSKFAVAVTNYPFPIQRAVRILKNQRIEMFDPAYFNTRSQDLEEAYHDAGQFYWGHAQAWLEEKSLFFDAAVPVILNRHRVQDIDTIKDWESAELMFQLLAAKKELPGEH